MAAILLPVSLAVALVFGVGLIAFLAVVVGTSSLPVSSPVSSAAALADNRPTEETTRPEKRSKQEAEAEREAKAKAELEAKEESDHQIAAKAKADPGVKKAEEEPRAKADPEVKAKPAQEVKEKAANLDKAKAGQEVKEKAVNPDKVTPGPELVNPDAATLAQVALAEQLDLQMALFEIAKAEYRAARQLKFARSLAADSLREEGKGNASVSFRLMGNARVSYQEIIKLYPDTLAAADALSLLAGEVVPQRPIPPEPVLPKGVKSYLGVKPDDPHSVPPETPKTPLAVKPSHTPALLPAGQRPKSVYVPGYTPKGGPHVQPHYVPVNPHLLRPAPMPPMKGKMGGK